MRTVDVLFAQYPAMIATENEEKKILVGAVFSSNLADGFYRVYGENGDFLMLGEIKNGEMKTVKSFFEVD